MSMRRIKLIKKIFLILFVIIILAGGGLFAYVSTVDWNIYKQQFSEKLSSLTGKKIELAGNINVKIFPTPTMIAEDIKIYENNSSEKLATIDHLDTVITLESMLKGTLDVKSLSLVGAEVWINTDKNNNINWLEKSEGPGFTDNEINTRLHNLNIQNAIIHYDNEYLGINFELTQVKADIQASSLYGPYRIDGNFVKDEDHFGIAISLGDFSQLADIPINFAITHPKSDSFLRFDGTYNPNDGDIKGDFSGGADKTADFANILAGITILEEQYNIPLQFSVGLEANHEKVDLSSFVIKYGDLIEGSGNILIPLLAENDASKRTIKLKYQLLNLDLRPLLSIAKAELEVFKNSGSIYEPNTDMNLEADISAEKVIISDAALGAFENLTIKGDWTDNVLNINEFYAACPGNIVLSLTGSLIEDNKSPQYYVKTSINGKNFLSFLNTWNLGLEPQVQSTYRNVDLTFNLTGNNSAISFNDVNFLMDNMKINSTIGITLSETNTFYEVQIDAENVNLDNYLPKKKEIIGFMPNLKDYINTWGEYIKKDMNALINVTNLTLNGIKTENVSLEFNTSDGIISITQGNLTNFLDSNLNISGSITDVSDNNMNIEEISYSLSSNSINTLIEKSLIPLPKWKIFNNDTFKISGTYSGDLTSGKNKSLITTDDIRFEYDGNISYKNSFNFDGKTIIKATNFGDFINQTGGNVEINVNNRFVFNCETNIKGNVEQWNFDNANCSLGVAEYKGNGSIEKNKNTYKITSQMDVNNLNLDSFINIQKNKTGNLSSNNRNDEFISRPTFNKDTFSFSNYSNVILDISLSSPQATLNGINLENVNAHILNNNNIMNIENMSLKYDDINISGNLNINYNDKQLISGNINFDNLNISELGGKIYKINNANIKGDTMFEANASSFNEIINNAKGKVNLQINDLRFTGFDFENITNDLNDRKYSKGLFQKVRDNLQKGLSSFDPISANLEFNRGSFNIINLPIKNQYADIKMNGSINIDEWKLNNDFAVTLPEAQGQPSFMFTLSGMINKPTLDINIEDIVKKYDEHWAKIEAEEAARKAEAERVLQTKMASVQQIVQNTSEQINQIISLIEEYKKLSDNNLHIGWYNQQTINLENYNKETEDFRSLAHTSEYTSEDIENIDKRLSDIKKEITSIKNEAIKHYEDDVYERLDKLSENANKSQEKGLETYNEYQDMIQSNFDEMLQIEASEHLIRNIELKNLQKDMDEQIKLLKEEYSSFSKQYEEASNITDIPVLEKTIEAIKSNLTDLDNKNKDIDSVYNETAILLQNLYDENLKIYEDKKAKEEAAKKAKEEEEKNKQDNSYEVISTETLNSPINVSGTINSATEQSASNIDEPKQTILLKTTSDNEVNSNSKVSGTIKTSYDNEEKVEINNKNNGILIKSSGAVQKATGTITVK